MRHAPQRMDQDRFYRGAEIRVFDLAIPNKAIDRERDSRVAPARTLKILQRSDERCW